ncbi:MAG: leucine-rich repeat domain-containing protein [Symploca sp. SIO3E6]|nr:leucine-rich repeat domain-containing protein [Caldora sp. SIO3E6]
MLELFIANITVSASVEPTSFAQWCHKTEEISPAARQTVQAMLEAAETQDCDRADTILSQRRELSLVPQELFNPTAKLTDISPLASLTQLTHLELPYNNIKNVSPLAGLTNLTYLDLQANDISVLTPLANLTKLRSLRLGVNAISDVRPLASLTQLNWLELENNQIENIQGSICHF